MWVDADGLGWFFELIYCEMCIGGFRIDCSGEVCPWVNYRLLGCYSEGVRNHKRDTSRD